MLAFLVAGIFLLALGGSAFAQNSPSSPWLLGAAPSSSSTNRPSPLRILPQHRSLSVSSADSLSCTVPGVWTGTSVQQIAGDDGVWTINSDRSGTVTLPASYTGSPNNCLATWPATATITASGFTLDTVNPWFNNADHPDQKCVQSVHIAATFSANSCDSASAHFSNSAGYDDAHATLSRPPTTYRVGGMLTGLTGSGSAVLQNNGGDNLTVGANGTFNFATPVANGQSYAVTVLSSPSGLFCTVTQGNGVVANADVTNVQVSCAPTKTYTYSGKGFKLFQCLTSPNPDCASPGLTNPYKITNSITATLTVAIPLGNNLGPTDASVLPGFQLTLNDGQNTLTQVGSFGQYCYGCGAWVTTNANGEISSWYLDVNNGEGGTDIFTLYDPNGAIAAACVVGNYSCISFNAAGHEEDFGGYYPYPLRVYGYNKLAHGSFSPAYPGGSTTAGNCLSSEGLPCNLVPGNSFAIRGPNAAAIPPGTILTQQECVVPADPRGANCGAVNGHLPRSLNVSDLPQCKGFGNEVIPDYLCGASGNSGTGFALILGNAEQIDTFNGTYGDSELDVEKIPGLKGAATNPTCPKGLPGAPPIVPSALAAVATRSGSLVEEQTPERTLDGRPLLIEMTSSCDPPRSNHGPGLTLEGVGFKLRTDDPAVIGGLSRAQRLLVFANYKFLNLDAVLLFTKFPTNTPTRKNLQNCINKSQSLLNSGPSHYSCAAEQIYRCEQIVEPGTDFHEFGTTTGPFLRLPDPYGDAVRRLGNLYYTINTRINGQYPNADWPLPDSPGHPAGDPYPGVCP